MDNVSSSAARIAANIANAQRSTGPRSAEGKQKVSQNARKHGFTGARFFCPPDLLPLLEDIEAQYREAIGPSGLLEEDAFLQLRNARFNMERAQLLIDNLGSQSVARGLDPLEDPQVCPQILLYQRYFNQAQAAFHRYLKLLRQLQTERALRQQALTSDSLPGLAEVRPSLHILKLNQHIRSAQPTPPPAGTVIHWCPQPPTLQNQSKPNLANAA